MADYVSKIKESDGKVRSCVEAANEAILKNDLDLYGECLNNLDAAEKDFADNMKAYLYDKFMTAENPIVAAVQQKRYTIWSHKVEYVPKTKTPTGVSLVGKSVKVDLLDFCASKKIPTAWKYRVEKFNQLLTLRVATEQGWEKERRSLIESTYFLSATARDIELGKTPMSVSALTKTLQDVVDAVMFVDNGEGKNQYKVLKKHVHFILNGYTRVSSRDDFTLVCASTKFLLGILTEVMYSMVTGCETGIVFRKAKEKKSAQHPVPIIEVSDPESNQTSESVKVAEVSAA